jgi:hypothetical protein
MEIDSKDKASLPETWPAAVLIPDLEGGRI